ncbi:hypothetical protein D9M71_423290 [compost metagenome]
MVTSMVNAVTTRNATPSQVRCRAWVVKLRRYSSTASPVEGTKWRKTNTWMRSPMPSKAGIAESMAKLTVIIGTTANRVV